jgi:hypothetical protein
MFSRNPAFEEKWHLKISPGKNGTDGIHFLVWFVDERGLLIYGELGLIRGRGKPCGAEVGSGTERGRPFLHQCMRSAVAAWWSDKDDRHRRFCSVHLGHFPAPVAYAVRLLEATGCSC